MKIIVDHKDCPDRNPLVSEDAHECWFNKDAIHLCLADRSTCPRALPDWNSCEHEPPKERKLVQTATPYENKITKEIEWKYEEMIFDPDKNHLTWKYKSNIGYTDKPTHWRERPAPPKLEEVNDE